MSTKLVLVLLVFLTLSNLGFSQNEQAKQDSLAVYKKINDYSKRNKLTKSLVKIMFRRSHKPSRAKQDTTTPYTFERYEGKVIRNINVQSYAPFGHDLKDSTKTPEKWYEKTANNLHANTKGVAIKNLLLFSKNSNLDPLLMSESERLIRSQNFIRDVVIRAQEIKNSKDSIDIYIDVLDSWSTVPSGSISPSTTALRLKERNFMGLGQEFDTRIKREWDTDRWGYDVKYTLSNIKNTFISTSIEYRIDVDGYYTKGFHVERPFYSPLTRWAGGFDIEERFRKDSLPNAQQEYKDSNFKYIYQDLWAAHAFDIFKGNTERERTSKLITGGRLLHVDYRESPEVERDSINYFSNETFFMASIGLSSRQFIKDQYIFNDGIVEYVPVGTAYAITVGQQHKNQDDRFYTGVRASHGNYFKWGYLSTNFEYGTFFNGSHLEQSTYSASLSYFTNLQSLGSRWQMRNFIKSQVIIGTNRLDSPGDRLSLNQRNKFTGVHGSKEDYSNSSGIQGFKSELMGTKKLLLSLQTQFYSPWRIVGFRLNPYVNFTGGLLGDETNGFSQSKVYASFGAGVIVRNDYLVFSSFQLSFSFFPEIPGQGHNVFKTNNFESQDFGFQNFNVDKPRTVWYN